MKDIEKMTKAELISIIYRNQLFAMEDPLKIKMPSDLFPALAKYSKKDQEHFLVATLNGNHQVIKVHPVTIGTANRTLVHPREVFKRAIKDNAVAIIIAHNHPSGQLQPSVEDLQLTERMKKAGEIIGIPVLDHIIFGKYSFNSLLEEGSF